MANELAISTQITYSKSLAFLAAQIQQSVTISGVKYCDLVQNIGGTQESILFGDITTPGFVMLQNIGLYPVVIRINTADTAPSDALPINLVEATATAPGGIALFTLSQYASSSGTISAKCNTIGQTSDITVRAIAP